MAVEEIPRGPFRRRRVGTFELIAAPVDSDRGARPGFERAGERGIDAHHRLLLRATLQGDTDRFIVLHGLENLSDGSEVVLALADVLAVRRHRDAENRSTETDRRLFGIVDGP